MSQRKYCIEHLRSGVVKQGEPQVSSLGLYYFSSAK